MLAGLVLLWVALVGVLWVTKPDETTVREALRLLPDFVPVLGYPDDAGRTAGGSGDDHAA